jgi:hypothetical protein
MYDNTIFLSSVFSRQAESVETKAENWSEKTLANYSSMEYRLEEHVYWEVQALYADEYKFIFCNDSDFEYVIDHPVVRNIAVNNVFWKGKIIRMNN